MMRPWDAVRRCLTSGYAAFGGRARWSEFWWFWLFNTIAYIVAALLDVVFGFGPPGVDDDTFVWRYLAAFADGTGPITLILTIAILLPTVAVGARRLHDAGRSGWWQLLALVPIVGTLVLLWFWTRPTEPGPNRFGPPPAGA